MTTKIMLVDDALIMRMMLRDIIMKMGGCEIVAEASAPAQVMPLLAENKPDIVCLDLTLDDSPEPAGMALLGEIERSRPGTRVVIISAIDQKEITARALALGARAYIAKPFDAGEVAATLRRLGAGV